MKPVEIQPCHFQSTAQLVMAQTATSRPEIAWQHVVCVNSCPVTRVNLQLQK